MNRQTAVASAPFQSLHRSPDDIVLASMPLREGTDRSRLSRFGDDCWDMAPAIFQTRARYVSGILDFTDIDCLIESLTAKEYIHALLNERLSDGRVRLHLGAARTTLRHLRRFMAFVRERLGRFDAALIDQDLIDAYRAALTGESSAAPREMTRRLKPIVDLHRLAPWLTCGGLGFLPWGGRTLTRVAGCGERGEENRTPRIPEPVIGALLHWSLKYLGLQTIQENAGTSRLIREAVAELGIERGGMDTPITIDPDTGRPWRGRFDHLSLVEEEKHLQTAAYVLCAYLPGMRDGEVQAMRPGCVARSLSADGMIERLAVRSTVHKHRGIRDKAGKGERAAPALSRCAPDRCPNACITARHLPVWEASIAEAEELLRDKRLPRLQREALQRDNERKRRLIAPLKVGGAS